MPRIKVSDVELYYEIHGQGEPLLLIEGLSYSSWMWFKQVSELAKHFQVIVFDNRGVGESDKPDCVYTTAMMAQDCAALVDKLGFTKVNVLGVSMGGLIAQQLALDFPAIVDKLILSCTGHNGPNAVMPTPEVLALLQQPKGNTAREKAEYAICFTTTEKNRREKPELIKAILDRQLAEKVPGYAYNRQLGACVMHNSEPRLGEIKCATLILTGDSDLIFPIENSYRLHRMIGGSELKIIENGGHLFFIECFGEFNQAVIEFLTRT